MRLLLHACCAPCSVSCVKALRAVEADSEGIEPRLFWYNPNIHPYSEYKLRRGCLEEFAANENLTLNMVGEYGLHSFLDEVYPETENRCVKCYRMRLEKTASAAAKEGYNAFSTTLLISPYQDHDAIRRAGEDAAAKYAVDFFYRDFRPLFRDGQSAARARGMYMQKYCGCIFSEEERNLRVTRRIAPCAIANDKRNSDDNSRPPEPPVEQKFHRLTLLIGEENLEKLRKTRVLVFGAGGVGSWAAEALVRSGIGKLGIIDNDTVCASNINRQAQATTLTIGQSKASALKKRLLEINGACEITAHDELFCRENAGNFNIESADYVIDAIDSVNHKLDLIEIVRGANVTLFSSMGMALKTDPSRIKTASIWDTSVCPLARIVRQGLRKRGYGETDRQLDFTVVYSDEQRAETENLQITKPGEKTINGSMVTVTASAGLLLANLALQSAVKAGGI